MESPWKVTGRKLIEAGLFLLIIFKFEGSFHPSMIAEQRYLQLDWFRWSLLFFFVIFLQRVQYYYAWTVGLGFVSDFPGLNKLKLNGVLCQ